MGLGQKLAELLLILFFEYYWVIMNNNYSVLINKTTNLMKTSAKKYAINVLTMSKYVFAVSSN